MLSLFFHFRKQSDICRRINAPRSKKIVASSLPLISELNLGSFHLYQKRGPPRYEPLMIQHTSALALVFVSCARGSQAQTGIICTRSTWDEGRRWRKGNNRSQSQLLLTWKVWAVMAMRYWTKLNESNCQKLHLHINIRTWSFKANIYTSTEWNALEFTKWKRKKVNFACLFHRFLVPPKPVEDLIGPMLLESSISLELPWPLYIALGVSNPRPPNRPPVPNPIGRVIKGDWSKSYALRSCCRFPNRLVAAVPAKRPIGS